MTRWARRLAVTTVLMLLVLPVLTNNDSFPLSTYPMYSRTRGDVVAIATANGVDAAGEPQRLSLGLIGDIDDPLIVEALLRDAIRAGRETTLALCEDIAARVVGKRANVVEIEVVTERHDVVARASDDDSLVDRTVHATCEVDL